MDQKVSGQRSRRRALTRQPSPGMLCLYSQTGARKYLTQNERQSAIKAARSLNDDHRLFALTLAWTGARISEVLALTPESLQPDRNIVVIRTLKQRKERLREVPLPPRLMQDLVDRYLRGPQRRPRNATLWTFSRSTAWRIIKTVMAIAGVKGAAACPKGFRHAFGVGTIQAGVPVTLLQKWLGHARLTTTAIYTDVTGPEEMAFANKYWNYAQPK